MYGPYRFAPPSRPGDASTASAAAPVPVPVPAAPASPKPAATEGETRPVPPFMLPDLASRSVPSSPLRADPTLSPASSAVTDASLARGSPAGTTPRTRQRRFFAISAADLDSDSGSEASNLTPTRPGRRAHTAYGRSRRGHPAPPARGGSFTSRRSRATRPGARFRVVADGNDARAEYQRGKPALVSFRRQQESMRRLAR